MLIITCNKIEPDGVKQEIELDLGHVCFHSKNKKIEGTTIVCLTNGVVALIDRTPEEISKIKKDYSNS